MTSARLVTSRVFGRFAGVAAVAWGCSLAACGSDWQSTHAGPGGAGTAGKDDRPPPTGYPQGLRVEGSRLVDEHGEDLVLRGVNRSGTEYRCIQGGGFFDGPDDEDSIAAMTAWNVNSVRVPLNETCWLGINGAPVSSSGEPYRQAIRDYVTRLHRYDLIPILELHWAAPGEERATEQRPMPNVDHTRDFWADVARTFADDSGVLLEPFNEPYLYQFGGDLAQVCGAEAWDCWRNGCTVEPEGYSAAGMQALVDAIREHSNHVILLGGLDWSNCLDGMLDHLPSDPQRNLAASWHVYNFNRCNHRGCWDGAPAEIAERVPLVVTELGEDTCQSGWVTSFMDWLDERELGYLAWQWNRGACVEGDRTTALYLIRDYENAAPSSDYAQAIYDRFVSKSD